MASKKRKNEDSWPSRRPPAKTPEGRERQLISAAVDLAEKQLQEGTASAQVITHYLKLGSSREKLEQEKMVEEVEVLKAKREAMAAAKRIEDLYAEAIKAMRHYAGAEPEEVEEDDEFDD